MPGATKKSTKQPKQKASQKGVPKKRVFVPVSIGSSKAVTKKVARVKNPGLRQNGKVALEGNMAAYYAHHKVAKNEKGEKVIVDRKIPRPVYKKASGLTCADPKYVPAINPATGDTKCITTRSARGAERRHIKAVNKETGIKPREGSDRVGQTHANMHFIIQKINQWHKEGKTEKAAIKKGINWLRQQTRNPKKPIAAGAFTKIWETTQKRLEGGMVAGEALVMALRAGVRAYDAVEYEAFVNKK